MLTITVTCSVVPNINAFPFVCKCVGDVLRSGGEETRTMMLGKEDMEVSRMKVISSLYMVIYWHIKCLLTALHSILHAGYWKSAYSTDPILGGKVWKKSGRARRNQTEGKLKCWMQWFCKCHWTIVAVPQGGRWSASKRETKCPTWGQSWRKTNTASLHTNWKAVKWCSYPVHWLRCSWK